MTESDLASFAVWSAITIVLIAVSGYSYRAFLRRKNDETPSP